MLKRSALIKAFVIFFQYIAINFLFINSKFVWNRTKLAYLNIFLSAMQLPTILNLVLKAHAKLPSERVLSEQFQTTRVAAREALLALETDGLIYRLDRRGWYVRSPRIIYHPQSTKNFNQFVIEQGYEPSTEVISSELTQATSWDAKHLKVEKGHPIYSVWRRRCINGRPVLVEHLRVNAELFLSF